MRREVLSMPGFQDATHRRNGIPQYFRLRAASAFFLRFTLGFS
jgi:hypothetical protein